MDLKFRRGTDPDAAAVSALYLRARKAAKATIPMTAHTDDEVRRWIAERVVPHTELWVVEDDGVASESWCKSTGRFAASPSAYGLGNSGDRPAGCCR